MIRLGVDVRTLEVCHMVADRIARLRADIVIPTERRFVVMVGLAIIGVFVVLADAFYPGWALTVDDRPAEILRTNRMMRGAALEAGRHRLVYEYRPRSFA